MQGRENSGESRVSLEMLRAMYPGHCGYKSETGGIMKNLRESTNNTKVSFFILLPMEPGIHLQTMTA
jgi:Zn-dependent M16 (insulinase) family peptidase